MKRLVATSLLLGYIMLVPFCFFGGALVASADTMNMIGNSAHQITDCGMLSGGCGHEAGAAGMDSIAHHVGMYLSVTQTPLGALTIMLTVLVAFLLVATGLILHWLSVFFSPTVLSPHARRSDEPQNKTRQSILTWLSLFETSPNFA